MRRKEDGEVPNTQIRQTYRMTMTPQKQAEIEIGSFLQFYKTLPKSTQSQILPSLQLLSSTLPNQKRLLEIVSNSSHETPQHSFFSRTSRNAILMGSQLLGIKNLGQKLLKKDSETQKDKISNKKEDKQSNFNSINVIHPKFEIYYRLSREFAQQGQGFSHQKPQQSIYFCPPRLFVRLEERKHFKSANQLKGNILLLSVQGNSIAGRNGIAITDKNYVQWWEKTDDLFLNGIFEQEKVEERQISSQTFLKNDKQKPQEQEYKKLEFKFKIHGHHGKVTSVSVSNDQLFMLTAGTDNVVKLWCLRSQMQLTQYRCHIKTIWSVQFCDSGYYFLTSSADGLAKMFKTDEPSAVRIFSGHTQDVYKAKFMPNPDYAVTSSADATVRIWNIQKAEAIQVFRFVSSIFTISVSFSGRYLAACQESGLITVFDLIKGSKLNSFAITTEDTKKAIQEPTQKRQKSLLVHDMSFSHNDRQFACVSSKYIVMYSMDAISQKVAGNIYSIYGQIQQDRSVNKLSPSQVIHIGRDMTLFYCKYHPKNYLIVGGTAKKY